ncbi:MAG TPA: hypothetical protein VJP83_03730 [Terriglobales bacterium]|jgi:hypothetical protein|nr:hypothetical protein [Terriglobales bacterium]
MRDAADHAYITTTANMYVKEVSENSAAMQRFVKQVEFELQKTQKLNGKSETAYSAVSLQ